jgi:hypothetical protein
MSRDSIMTGYRQPETDPPAYRSFRRRIADTDAELARMAPDQLAAAEKCACRMVTRLKIANVLATRLERTLERCSAMEREIYGDDA